jgi:hypothetical protein
MNTSTCAAVAPVLASRRRAASSRRGRRRGALALLSAASLVLAGCGSGASPSASSLLKDAFSSHQPITSGLLGLSFELTGPGGARGPTGFSLQLEGPFESAGAGRLPHFALTLTVDTAGRMLRAGAISTAGHLYLQLGGLAFLAPAANMRALEQGYAQAGGGSLARSSPTFATLGIEPEAWLIHPSVAGSARVAGSDTVHIVSGLDARRFLADAERLSSAGLVLGAGSGLITPARAAALSAYVRAGRVDLFTGTHDHLLRRLQLRAQLSATAAARAALGHLAGGTLLFGLQLAQLDRPQAITPPGKLQPLSRLGPALEQLAPAPGPRPSA